MNENEPATCRRCGHPVVWINQSWMPTGGLWTHKARTLNSPRDIRHRATPVSA